MNELLLVNYLLEKTEDPGMKRWVLSSIVGRTYYHNLSPISWRPITSGRFIGLLMKEAVFSALLAPAEEETLEKF